MKNNPGRALSSGEIRLYAPYFSNDGRRWPRAATPTRFWRRRAMWGMLLALIGAVAAQLMLARWHDRSMEKLADQTL